MTEEEAKTKWCPFARVAGEVGGPAQGASFNRWTTGAAGGAADPASCIASACMAWRWYETHVPNGTLPEPIANVAPEELVRSSRSYGCCGLAGPWFGQMRGFERAIGANVQ